MTKNGGDCKSYLVYALVFIWEGFKSLPFKSSPIEEKIKNPIYRKIVQIIIETKGKIMAFNTGTEKNTSNNLQITPEIKLDNIAKNFGKTRALDNVSFHLEPGEIIALVGENGAGKTTLMNIIYGIYHQDSGNILIQGVDVSKMWSPKQAMAHGIYMIHQHFMLVNEFTVLQNIVLPTLKWGDMKNNWRKYEREIKDIFDEYNFKVRLKDKIKDLSMGERQQVEIIKAFYQNARVLILDEPTSTLIPQQVDKLLELLVNLRSRGYSVVFVTHKLKEVMAISDKITVLRKGKHIKTLHRDKTTINEVAYLMVGREWITPIKRTSVNVNAEPILKVQQLTVESEYKTTPVNNVSITVRKGEIVGVAGVAGNGQVELSEAIAGTRKIKYGTILINNGVDIGRCSVKKRQQSGLAYIPEDRQGKGILNEMSVEENLYISYIENKPYSKYGIVQLKVIREKANQIIHDFNIKTSGPDVPIGNLSGGNQQKIILARILIGTPSMIIACQPTSGLDFTATEYIRKKLVESANSGTGILLISNDLDELLELSDRIFVMYRGRIVGNINNTKEEEISLETLGLMMAGAADIEPVKQNQINNNNK